MLQKYLLFGSSLFWFVTAQTLADELVITPSSNPATDDVLYVCEYAGSERLIELNYPNGAPLPCEVIYHRSHDGNPYEVLWEARHDTGFCENKTSELLAQLKSVGWLCTEL